MSRNHSPVVIRQRNSQRGNSHAVQPAANVYLRIPLGIPLRQNHDRGPTIADRKKTRMHQVIFRPGILDLAGEREYPRAAGSFRRMQMVVIGGRGCVPISTMLECPFYPGVEKLARVGSTGGASDVLQP